MISETASFITAISKATGIVKNLIEISKDTSIKEKSVELLSVITSLQSEMLLLQSNSQDTLNELSSIKQKLKEYERWNEIESLYKPIQINTGVFVYESKIIDNDKDSYHLLCTNCFKSRKQSILQKKKVMGYTTDFECPKCKNSFQALVGKKFESLFQKIMILSTLIKNPSV